VQLLPDDADVNADELDEPFHRSGRWMVRIDCIRQHVLDQGTWVRNLLTQMTEDDQLELLHEIATYAVSTVSGISVVQAERDNQNRASEDLAPPVFPAQLVALRTNAFISSVIDPRREQILETWTLAKLELCEVEHRLLLVAYRTSAPFKQIIDSQDHKTMFNAAWDALDTRFANLRELCGTLATVFHNTTSVESDFSVVKWEMDSFRKSLMSLSLEGVMQSKQLHITTRLAGDLARAIDKSAQDGECH
jgi:hypothetical protein